MKTLQDAYRQSLPMAIEAIQFALSRLDKDGGDALASLRRHAHQLRGSGASYGYPAVSEAAVELELAPAELAKEKALTLVAVLQGILEDPGEELKRAYCVTADEATGNQIKELLIESGWTAETYSSRAAAMNAATANPPTLMMLDMVLPDGDGRSLLHELKHAGFKDLSLIVFGAGWTPALREEFIRLGAVGFLNKPINQSELTSFLHTVQASDESDTGDRDPLTDLPNQLGIRNAFESIHALARRNGAFDVSLALIDVDHLTEINSKYGYLKGDEVIRKVGLYLRNRLRTSDQIGRWGGDRYLLVMPDTQERQASESLSGILHEMQEAIHVTGVEEVPVSYSAGVAQIEAGSGFEEAFEYAETRSFRAKTAGRGRVVCSIADQELDRVRILIADDDEMIARLIAHRLEREGFEVLYAADGKSALDKVRDESNLKMIILDVKMPMRDGFDVLREIRTMNRHRETPVLMLTSMGSERDVIRGFDLGATDYLTKPFSPRELTARILHHLKRKV